MSFTGKGHKVGKARNKPSKKAGHFTNIAKAVQRRAVGIEHKFYDTFLDSLDISSLGNATGGEADPSATSLISTPPRGDSAISRDGKHIVIDTIIIEGCVQLFPSNSAGAISEDLPLGQVFVALVQDTQTNGATAQSEDVWVNPSGDSALMASPLKNLLNATRFITHKVWRIDVPVPNAASNQTANTISTQGLYKTFDGFLKVNIPVNFNAGGDSAVASVVDNSLHVYAYTNTTAVTRLNYNARIRFVG